MIGWAARRAMQPDRPRRPRFGRYWMIAFWGVIAVVLLGWLVPDLLR